MKKILLFENDCKVFPPGMTYIAAEGHVVGDTGVCEGEAWVVCLLCLSSVVLWSEVKELLGLWDPEAAIGLGLDRFGCDVCKTRV